VLTGFSKPIVFQAATFTAGPLSLDPVERLRNTVLEQHQEKGKYGAQRSGHVPRINESMLLSQKKKIRKRWNTEKEKYRVNSIEARSENRTAPHGTETK